MNRYTSEDIRAYAKWLTQECQAAGLRAEQYGAEIFIHGASNHLSERIACRPDAQGDLRWHWSWGVPIGRVDDSARLLDVDDVQELVRSISKVVCVPLRPSGM
ncbi:hypothetical protein [Actinoallomurus rhizosphaericola]|uniref:hypothetical protein n=1 Tax=Actinoallomurus rhizosphaericola TaxID=2952536 RepID=UPI002093D815|nr:hypothetical protein [Actinoallomurus rhizosphaericola]MCO5997265.1 hypothetical protein [Actinoallomurus rhizosphaericola]